ncbi:MAG: RHS repeat-associated core domain-containing protein [Planctomycetota bacterium]|nr:MAG: RHS repeat-associated core domain-containing protein [Planctomycetota bacterium]REK46749.1 MAG: RHS repeat-associated core domain-containing protein [Planctomycetota bacterium]
MDHLFGYTGRAFDDETGLQNNLHRWFDPVTGRWASEDPIGFAAGDANLYRYVGNGPTNGVDPDGLAAIGELKQLAKESDPLSSSGESSDLPPVTFDFGFMGATTGQDQGGQPLWPLTEDGYKKWGYRHRHDPLTEEDAEATRKLLAAWPENGDPALRQILEYGLAHGLPRHHTNADRNKDQDLLATDRETLEPQAYLAAAILALRDGASVEPCKAGELAIVAHEIAYGALLADFWEPFLAKGLTGKDWDDSQFVMELAKKTKEVLDSATDEELAQGRAYLENRGKIRRDVQAGAALPGPAMCRIPRKPRQISVIHNTKKAAKDTAAHAHGGKPRPTPPKSDKAKRKAYEEQQKYKKPESHPNSDYPETHYHDSNKSTQIKRHGVNRHHKFKE